MIFKCNLFNLKQSAKVFFLFIIFVFVFSSCKKEQKNEEIAPTDNLALDSIVATKRNIASFEEIYITAYTRGKNINYKWTTNHGTMVGQDSITVKYWACWSCIGVNTIKCEISNEFGSISDTLNVNVHM